MHCANLQVRTGLLAKEVFILAETWKIDDGKLHTNDPPFILSFLVMNVPKDWLPLPTLMIQLFLWRDDTTKDVLTCSGTTHIQMSLATRRGIRCPYGNLAMLQALYFNGFDLTVLSCKMCYFFSV